ncbi:hypothetical protein ACES2L_13735 [Bdellovibrio bacteriovorus]
MKFTYPKKQWVMTTALLAVLGFNVSFNSNNEIAFADFASTEAIESNVPTAQGNLPVKYIKSGENKVLALVQLNTEGKICDSCDPRVVSLTASNTDNIQDLNVLLVKALSSSSAAEEKPAKVEVKEEKTDVLQKLADKCEKHDEDAEKLKCLTPKFLDALKKEKESISEEEAMAFFKEEVEKLIKSEMQDSHRISVKAYKSKLRGNAWDYYDDEEDSRDAEEILGETLELVKELHAKIPGKYKDIRKRLFKMQTEIVDEEALQVQRTIVQSSRQTDPREKMLLHQEADGRNVYLNQIISGLSESSREGMMEARRSGVLGASDRDVYADTWGNYAMEMRRSMNQFLYEYAATGKTPSSMVAGAYDLGTGYSTRLANPGRTGEMVSPGVASRAGTRFDGQSDVTVGIPKSNVNISFGEMTAITEESQKMRADIRKVFGK